MAAPKMAANSGSDAHRRRRLTADRTEYSRRRPTTRNVRTSSMPGNPTNQVDSTRNTIDETFNESYETAGIQPQGLGTEPKREKYQQPKQIDRSARVEYKKTMRGAANVAQDKVLRKKKVGVKKKFSQKRAVVVTGSIWAWAFPSWLFFQLPIAILGLVLLGLAGWFSSLINTVSIEESVGENGSFLLKVKDAVGGVFNTFAEAVGAVVKGALHALNIDFNPVDIFLIPYLITFLFGLLVLFVIYIIYKVRFLNPLSGDAAGMKIGALLFALVGYSIPILNLFPCFLVWTLVVLKYPK